MNNNSKVETRWLECMRNRTYYVKRNITSREILRRGKYYVEGKKGVCATYYVLRKLKKDKVTNRCNIICSLLNRNLSVVDDNLKRNKQRSKLILTLAIRVVTPEISVCTALWHHSTYCTTVRTTLSHLHIVHCIYTV